MGIAHNVDGRYAGHTGKAAATGTTRSPEQKKKNARYTNVINQSTAYAQPAAPKCAKYTGQTALAKTSRQTHRTGEEGRPN